MKKRKYNSTKLT